MDGITYLAVPIRISAPVRDPFLLPLPEEGAAVCPTEDFIPAPFLDAVSQTTASLDNLVLNTPCDNKISVDEAEITSIEAADVLDLVRNTPL